MEHLRLRSQLMRQGRLRSTHLDHLKSEEIKEVSCQNIFSEKLYTFLYLKVEKKITKCMDNKRTILEMEMFT